MCLIVNFFISICKNAKLFLIPQQKFCHFSKNQYFWHQNPHFA